MASSRSAVSDGRTQQQQQHHHQQQQRHSQGGASASSSLSSVSSANTSSASRRKPGAEFLSRTRYKSTIPTLPFDPKSLRYPFPEDMLYKYRVSSLEKYSQYSLPFPEMPLDLVDLGVFDEENLDATVRREKKTHGTGTIDPRDEPLLVDPDSLGEVASSLSTVARANNYASFLRRADYADGIETVRPFSSSLFSSSRGPESNRESKVLPLTDTSHEGQLRVIESTFEACAERCHDLSAMRHPRDPTIRAVAALPLLPDLRLWPNVYTLVAFEDHSECTGPVSPSSILLPRVKEISKKTLFGLYTQENRGRKNGKNNTGDKNEKEKDKDELLDATKTKDSKVMDFARAYDFKTVAHKPNSRLLISIDREAGCAYYSVVSQKLVLTKHRGHTVGPDQDGIDWPKKLVTNRVPIRCESYEQRVNTVANLGLSREQAEAYVSGAKPPV